MSVSLLVDNDIVIKLAKMDVFKEGMACIGAGPQAVGSLRIMLRYMGVANAANRLKFTSDQAEADRLGAVLQTIVELELTQAEAELAATLMKLVLENGLDLQEGELALMVVAHVRGGLEVATGDKRALRSLPAFEKHWPQLGALRERFICCEQIFKRICAIHGLTRIQAAVRCSPSTEPTIAFVLEKTAAGGSANFMKGLDLVVADHLQDPAPGWLKEI
jgi:hypothetical protein